MSVDRDAGVLVGPAERKVPKTPWRVSRSRCRRTRRPRLVWVGCQPVLVSVDRDAGVLVGVASYWQMDYCYCVSRSRCRRTRRQPHEGREIGKTVCQSIEMPAYSSARASYRLNYWAQLCQSIEMPAYSSAPLATSRKHNLLSVSRSRCRRTRRRRHSKPHHNANHGVSRSRCRRTRRPVRDPANRSFLRVSVDRDAGVLVGELLRGGWPRWFRCQSIEMPAYSSAPGF